MKKKRAKSLDRRTKSIQKDEAEAEKAQQIVNSPGLQRQESEASATGYTANPQSGAAKRLSDQSKMPGRNQSRLRVGNFKYMEQYGDKELLICFLDYLTVTCYTMNNTNACTYSYRL